MSLVLVGLMATVVLTEAASRIFWKLQYGIPLLRPVTLLNALYPELWQLGWKAADVRGQNAVRILLLGGSVMHPAWGNVEQELRERLTIRLGQAVVVFNMAEIGHTSRDSYVKYRTLAGQRFDMVVFYHGINEARANNVPPAMFRSDYSHYAWYDRVNALQSCDEGRRLVVSCTLRFLAVGVKTASGS